MKPGDEGWKEFSPLFQHTHTCCKCLSEKSPRSAKPRRLEPGAEPEPSSFPLTTISVTSVSSRPPQLQPPAIKRRCLFSLSSHFINASEKRLVKKCAILLLRTQVIAHTREHWKRLIPARGQGARRRKGMDALSEGHLIRRRELITAVKDQLRTNG